MSPSGRPFQHPHDTPLSGALRFAVEAIVWVAAPWAVYDISIWLVGPAAIILLGLPSVFSTRGDKRHIIVPTPGPVRLAIEIAFHAIAVGVPWLVWPVWLAVACLVVAGAALATGLPRARWLRAGAPAD